MSNLGNLHLKANQLKRYLIKVEHSIDFIRGDLVAIDSLSNIEDINEVIVVNFVCY